MNLKWWQNLQSTGKELHPQLNCNDSRLCLVWRVEICHDECDVGWLFVRKVTVFSQYRRSPSDTCHFSRGQYWIKGPKEKEKESGRKKREREGEGKEQRKSEEKAVQWSGDNVVTVWFSQHLLPVSEQFKQELLPPVSTKRTWRLQNDNTVAEK